MDRVRIGSSVVGRGPCYVIAEAGSNHDGSLDQALALIDAAKAAGADAVKFQLFTGANLYALDAPRFEYLGDDVDPRGLLTSLELPREWIPKLIEHCRLRSIDFMCSPFDREAVDLLDQDGLVAYKVASFELVDTPFLEYIGARGRPVIMSTGMATMAEIDEALAALTRGGDVPVCLLQCASVYPAEPASMNLRAIRSMREAFGVPVGLSDHTRGSHVAVAAVAMGAALVEKHFTLDRTLPGPDHGFAADPEELRVLIQHIRDVELAFGSGRKSGPSDAESVEMFQKARRSIVAACDIPAGATIERGMLTIKRPGHGIHPRHLEALVGRVAREEIAADHVITWDAV